MPQVRQKLRFSRDEGGATAIEFALVAPLLFFSLFSLIEIGMLGMMSSALDNAVVESARRIRTGRDDGPTSAASFKNQICDNMGGAVGSCLSRLTVSVQRFPKFYDANQVAAAQPAGEFNKGGPGDIVLVKANYRWPLMTPFLATAFNRDGPMQVTIASRTAFKNEPYQ
ncbi:TadE/TadG family type IV pilus assembly protein [Phenylobacterium sp.]|uniref:TadE/TadG family type IV pilus assembly protein n=1 Tax=Phenylobacterium sp. TaxID=1871053 RepID=UPI0025EE45C0|nr:TadE/TadG family type IV pilus assembly protein [Phenylobacterium sp.]MBX3486211.1 pilus assembly protein [Phenylobacterium sp.]MCW5760147.1 pilus assembly protein [Phenylobacterium sp.]